MKLLSDVTVGISRGAMVAVMGLNGAGKTTLLKILSGYLTPSAGEAVVKTSDKTLAQTVAFVPQDFPTDFPFTVLEFVMMGRFAWRKGFFNRAADFDKVRSVLKRLFLEGFENRLVSTLSGGERQRVLLARALAQDTDAILLDEPVNHLDIRNKIEILNLIKEENRTHGTTIVAVMHDPSDVQAYFNEVLLLKAGRLKYFGGLSEAFTSGLVRDVFGVDPQSFPRPLCIPKQTS